MPVHTGIGEQTGGREGGREAPA
eukprot:COSAG05_NODE_24067_length_254_cov_0.651613_1_plen_22_part_01